MIIRFLKILYAFLEKNFDLALFLVEMIIFGFRSRFVVEAKFNGIQIPKIYIGQTHIYFFSFLYILFYNKCSCFIYYYLFFILII